MEESDLQTIAVDVMGGDGGVSAIVNGISLAVKLFPEEIGRLLLVGDEKLIRRELGAHKRLQSRANLEIFHAPQAIDMVEKPMHALRSKRNSSMFCAIDLLKEKKVGGLLSCGNTACLVAGGTLKLRTMEGIDRPALGTIIPAPANCFVLIDVGANPETSEKSLIHNAVLGSMYYNVAVNPEKKPRVGLLTIGTEEGKGISTVKNAHELLKKLDGEIDYRGPIEGFQLFSGEIDVVVCDGFVGNILLKSIEALAGTIKNYVKAEIKKNPLRMLGALIACGAFNSIKKKLTSDQYSGAPLLGLNGVVVKSHGSSSPEAIAHALRLTFRLAKKNSEHSLNDLIKNVNTIVEKV